MAFYKARYSDKIYGLQTMETVFMMLPMFYLKIKIKQNSEKLSNMKIYFPASSIRIIFLMSYFVYGPYFPWKLVEIWGKIYPQNEIFSK